VDFRLGHRQELENGDGIIDYLLGEAALTDYAADLPQSALVLMTMITGFAMAVMTGFAMTVMAGIAMTVMIGIAMTVGMPVVVFWQCIHIPAGVRVENVEFGAHQAVFAHLACLHAKALQPERRDILTDNIDIGSGVNQCSYEHIAADTG